MNQFSDIQVIEDAKLYGQVGVSGALLSIPGFNLLTRKFGIFTGEYLLEFYAA